ncbi:MAG TPA: hypothetical protein VEC94_08965 [Pseudolabrys sp.]|nr:hypothetical protein [Pseudolabrys sp.]
MTARIEIPPRRIAHARYLYEETDTRICRIWKMLGISRATFYERMDEWRWVKRRLGVTHRADLEPPADVALPPMPDESRPDPSAAAPALEATPEQQAELSIRVMRAVLRQMDAIESIQRRLHASPDMNSERTVRTLATLNRALRELAAITRTDGMTFNDAIDTDPVPNDLEQFRRELARRIEGLVDAERGGTGEGAGAPAAALAR